LIGGGHTHALLLLKWAMNPLPGVQVTLVNPQVKAPYTGMLPGHIAGHYERSELDIDLVRLARRANARLVLDHAVGIDTNNKRVQLSSRPDIAYDTLSIDIGIATDLKQVPGSDLYAYPAKPLGPFADAWGEFLQHIEDDEVIPNIAIIGAGVAGVELSLAMAHRLRSSNCNDYSIRLVESGDEPLREIGRFARRDLLRELHHYDVKVIAGARIDRITESEVSFTSDIPSIPADFVVTAAGAKPHYWLSNTGIALEKGYIAVDDMLRSVSTPNVFAVGDCAHLSFAPRPKAGVFAVREAPILFENLRADLSGQRMTRFHPQKSYLKLISKGRKSAVVDKWGVRLQGPWAWWLKDKIDSTFMAQFRQPVDASILDIPDDIALGVQPLMENDVPECGGCGSKIAQYPLLEGLSEAAVLLEASHIQPFDDAAILHRGERIEVLTADHLRAFTSDPWIMAKVTAIHAMGDIWAMNGQAETVLSHIILPRMAPEQQANMIREIMDCASGVFEACGAKIVGGHSSSGAELTIGFSVSGNILGPPTKVSGAGAGDVLVLTKPIGTGVLLAAEMRQEVDGEDYRLALASMCKLQVKSAAILAKSATAMTDVTGYGLAGHLMNILDASGVSARLDIDKLPMLSGAETLSATGVRSTLWPSNASIKSRMSVQTSPKEDLLFDPQTCGGLLASVPASKIDQIMSDFEATGETIWQIGQIISGQPFIEVSKR
jgi:selenide,water dikinase